MFANSVSDGGPVSRIHKELVQLITQDTPIFKWLKNFEETFLQRRYTSGNKPMKRFLASLEGDTP